MRAALVLAALVLAGPAAAQQGRDLYLDGCAQCHGLDGGGVEEVGPSLRDAGAASADFYVSTGRMPLDETGEQPVRRSPGYTRAEIEALVGYVASFGDGPAIPEPHPERGDLARGFRLYAESCAGCHQIVARGGSITGAQVPPLLDATPRQIAEAVRVGPWLMPSFDESQLDDEDLDDVIRYVQYARRPDDRGGWSLGNIGPIPEGLVAWLLAGTALVLVARVIGKRL